MRQTRASHVVLVVDDHEATRYATARALRDAGYKTREAATGALALAMAERVGALVLDMNLPDIQGTEVCRRLRAQPDKVNLPCVHVSSFYPPDEAAAKSVGVGGDGFLAAPLDPQELVAMVDRLLAVSPSAG